MNGKWISDIAHNLNADLLKDFFDLWQLIQTQHLDLSSEQEDQIVWSLDPRKFRGILKQFGLQNPVLRANIFDIPKADLEGLGHPTMQILPLATPAGSNLDSSQATATRMGEQLFLCALCKESRNFHASLRGVPEGAQDLGTSRALDELWKPPTSELV